MLAYRRKKCFLQLAFAGIVRTIYLVVMSFSTLLQTVDIDSDMIQGINRIERKNDE